jgi:hypothetical protein
VLGRFGSYKVIELLYLKGVSLSHFGRLSDLNNRHLFLTVLEVGKFRIKVLTDLVSGKDPRHQIWRWLPSGCICTRQREKSFLSCSVYKGIDSIHEGSTLITQSPLQMPSHWGLGLQHMNFGGDANR